MPLPGREKCAPNLRAIAWSMRWSSGFLKSSWITLWSTYWTARSTFTRGTPSCSYCMHAIVPVASWSSVWSIRSPIGSPGFNSPSTRCSLRIWRVRLSATAEKLLRDAHEHARRAREQRPVRRVAAQLGLDPQRPALLARDPRAHVTEAADGHRAEQIELEPARERVDARVVHDERHRLVEGRAHHAAVREARRSLVVLLEEEAAGERAVVLRRQLELQPEQ